MTSAVSLSLMRRPPVSGPRTWPGRTTSTGSTGPIARSRTTTSPWPRTCCTAATPSVAAGSGTSSSGSAIRSAGSSISVNEPVGSLAYSPDGTWVVSGSGGQSGNFRAGASVNVWDVSSGQRRTTLPGAKGNVRSVAVSPDGKFVAAGFEAGIVMVWDVGDGTEHVDPK